MNDLSEVVVKYDDLGDDEFDRFDRLGTCGKLVYRVELEIFLDATGPGDRVLDAGGGSGKFAIPLAEEGRDVDLVDISPEQCRAAADNAAERGVDIDVTNGDVRRLDGIEDDAYDAVLCIGGALSHVRDDIDLALEALGRVLKPGGTLVTSVMCRNANINTFYHTLCNDDDLPSALESLADDRIARHGSYHEIGEFYKYSSDEIVALLEEHGFDVESCRAIDRHSNLFEFPLAEAWEDERNRDALVEYELAVSELPWLRDDGNMILQTSTFQRDSGTD
jgi:ubiquinone/menaquinone biosynthesis C-methylase UbiE